jgi:hypothetical protein
MSTQEYISIFRGLIESNVKYFLASKRHFSLMAETEGWVNSLIFASDSDIFLP